jgi:hypothetical protein
MKVISALVRTGCYILLLSLGGVDAIQAAPSDTAPPLPAPTGNVVRVSTTEALQAAVRSLVSDTTILIAPGRYRLTTTLVIGNRPLRNIAIRGETNRRDDVTLVGAGMSNPSYGDAPFGIWVGNGVDGILIANLSVTDFYFHSIILNAGTLLPHVYNVRMADSGQQVMKVNPDSNGHGIARGIVEYSTFEFTGTSRDDYAKGLDVHGGSGWIVRNNLFRNIRAPGGELVGPAILLWRGTRDSLVEGNTFVNCQREIYVGAEDVTPDSHAGGIVRNNFIYRESWVVGDVGIHVADSRGTRVLHNTVILSGTYPNAIEYRFRDTADVLIANNLTDAAIRARDGATATLQNNVTSATPAMFAIGQLGQVHLSSSATAVIDKGTPVDVDRDWDGDRRPQGPAPDIGADEFTR